MKTDSEQRIGALRLRAKRRGLVLVKRGLTLDLRDGDRSLHRGRLHEIERYLATHHPRRRRRGASSGCAPPAEWTEIIGDYLTSLDAAGRPETTLALRQGQLSRLSREIGAPPVAVTTDALVAYMGAHPQWSTEHRRSNVAALRLFFRWAHKSGRISANPAEDLPSVREHKASPRPLPDAAWRSALLGADARTTLMIRLAGEAGLRRAEVAQVHHSDLMEGASGAQLLVHGKGGSKRVVPLSDSLADLVRQGAPGHTPGMPLKGWLFPDGFGNHLTAPHVGDHVGRALPPGFTMHTLRHRFATRAYRGTRNLRAVQTVLGHASIATTERYTAVDDDEVRAAMMAAML